MTIRADRWNEVLARVCAADTRSLEFARAHAHNDDNNSNSTIAVNQKPGRRCEALAGELRGDVLRRELFELPREGRAAEEEEELPPPPPPPRRLPLGATQDRYNSAGRTGQVELPRLEQVELPRRTFHI